MSKKDREFYRKLIDKKTKHPLGFFRKFPRGGWGVVISDLKNFIAIFLDTHVSLAPTHVSLSVGWSVGPLVTLSDFQRLVAPLEKLKREDPNYFCVFSESVFSKSVFSESVFFESVFFLSVCFQNFFDPKLT